MTTRGDQFDLVPDEHQAAIEIDVLDQAVGQLADTQPGLRQCEMDGEGLVGRRPEKASSMLALKKLSHKPTNSNGRGMTANYTHTRPETLRRRSSRRCGAEPRP